MAIEKQADGDALGAEDLDQVSGGSMDALLAPTGQSQGQAKGSKQKGGGTGSSPFPGDEVLNERLMDDFTG